MEGDMELQRDQATDQARAAHGSAEAGDRGDLRIPVRAEELVVDTQPVARRVVHVHKGVQEVEQTLRVPLAHDEAMVEHLRPDEYQPGDAEDPETIVIPIYEEQIVVEKRTVLKEYVRVRRQRLQTERTVTETVRREYVELREEALDDRADGAPAASTRVAPARRAETGGGAMAEQTYGWTVDQIAAQAPVYAVGGEQVGRVAEYVQPGDYLVVENGWFSIQDMYVPARAIARADHDGVYLRIGKDALHDERYATPPTLQATEPLVAASSGANAVAGAPDGTPVMRGADAAADRSGVLGEQMDMRMPGRAAEPASGKEPREEGQPGVDIELVGAPELDRDAGGLRERR